MKIVSYLWIILVGSTCSPFFFDIFQHQWDIPEYGWPSDAIKIAFMVVGLLLTILAVEKIKKINPNDYALIVEYPDNRLVGQSVNWEVVGQHENGQSIVRCKPIDPAKPTRVFLMDLDRGMYESGTGTLTVGGNDSFTYHEIAEDHSTSGC